MARCWIRVNCGKVLKLLSASSAMLKGLARQQGHGWSILCSCCALAKTLSRFAIQGDRDSLVWSLREGKAELEKLAVERGAVISQAAGSNEANEASGDLRHRPTVADNTSRRCEEEVAQTRAELEQVLANAAVLKAQLERRREASEQQRQELSRLIATQEEALRASAKKEAELKFALYQAKEDVRRNVELRLDRETELRAAEGRLIQHAGEAASLSQHAQESDAALGAEAAKREWLQRVIVVWSNLPGWWMLMPRKWRQQWLHQRLLRRGLFDAVAYLDRYPDVAATGLGPLKHYMRHGINENRDI
jgi:hypothetical protein